MDTYQIILSTFSLLFLCLDTSLPKKQILYPTLFLLSLFYPSILQDSKPLFCIFSFYIALTLSLHFAVLKYLTSAFRLFLGFFVSLKILHSLWLCTEIYFCTMKKRNMTLLARKDPKGICLPCNKRDKSVLPNYK